MKSLIKKYHNFIIDRRNKKLAPIIKIYGIFFDLPALGKHFRLRIISRSIDKTIAIRRAIDFGCGLGELSIMLSQKGASVKAYDMSEESILLLNEFSIKEDLKIKASVCDIEKIKIRGKFDFVSCVAVIDYLKTPHRFIKNISNMVSKNGTLCIGFPLKSRKVSKNYEHIAHAVTLVNGFNEKKIVDEINALGFVLDSREAFLPLNLFYYMTEVISFLSRIGMSYELSLVLVYPFFFIISNIAQLFLSHKGTEVVLTFRKI